MVSKAAKMKVVRAYMLMKQSGDWNAPISIQQKFYDAYQRTIASFEKRVGFSLSEADMGAIERLAAKMWAEKVMRGPGVDW